MSTLVRLAGYQIVLYSHDHRHPPHVHVLGGGGASKWLLEPLECAWSIGLTAGEERKIRKLMIQNIEAILAAWEEEWRRRDAQRNT